MVFEKIKNAITGAKGGDDLGNVARDLGAGSISKYLDGITYPVSKDELVVALKNNGAPSQLVDQVSNLTQGRFDSPEDVISKLKSQF